MFASASEVISYLPTTDYRMQTVRNDSWEAGNETWNYQTSRFRQLLLYFDGASVNEPNLISGNQ